MGRSPFRLASDVGPRMQCSLGTDVRAGGGVLARRIEPKKAQSYSIVGFPSSCSCKLAPEQWRHFAMEKATCSRFPILHFWGLDVEIPDL